MLNMLEEKIGLFENKITSASVSNGVWNYTSIPSIYKIGSVHTTNLANQKIEVQEVNNNEWYNIQAAPLTRPTLARPVYVNRQDGLNIYPNNINIIDISYTREPAPVFWGYVVVNDKALYNVTTSVNFDLHASEETELVYKILKLAGITLDKQAVVQVGQTLEQSQVQQEKI